jgi:hypothetical protein
VLVYVAGMNDTPDAISIISYLVAAAMLIPLGWWLKANYASDVGGFILSFFGY